MQTQTDTTPITLPLDTLLALHEATQGEAVRVPGKLDTRLAAEPWVSRAQSDDLCYAATGSMALSSIFEPSSAMLSAATESLVVKYCDYHI